MPRKTIKVRFLLDHCNRANAALVKNDVENGQAKRQSLNSLIERVLLETNNYRGFTYTDGEQGMGDDSQRFYYVDGNLRTERERLGLVAAPRPQSNKATVAS